MGNYAGSFYKLNRYSWSLIVAFICATIAMQYHTGHITFEGFYLSLPLIVIIVYWCEQRVPLVRMKDCLLTKQESFGRDLFMISYSFVLAGLFSLLFQYNNSDIKGWWPVFFYFNSLVGVLFAFVYSLIALMLPRHKMYVVFSTSIIMILITLLKFWPNNIYFLFIEKVDFYYVIIFSLLIIHVLSVLGYKLYRMLHKKPFK